MADKKLAALTRRHGKAVLRKNGNIALPVGRLSYAALFKAVGSRKFPNQPPKFQTDVLFHPDADLKILIREIKKVIAESGSRYSYKQILKEQDEYYEGSDALIPGGLFIKVRRDNAPAVVDQAREPITERDINSGDYAIVTVRVYAPNEGVPVAVGLQNVQLVAKGKPLGGGGMSNPDDDFEELDADIDEADDLEDDEDDTPPPRAKKKKPARDYDDEDDTPPPRAKKKKPARDYDDEDDEDDTPPPRAKKKKPRRQSDIEDELDDEIPY